MAFSIDFLSYLIDFGSIWGGFWEDFSKICWIFLENAAFVKTLKKPWFLQCFVRVELLKNHKNQQKIDKKSMQILSGKKRIPKWLQKWIWEGLGLHLGGVWDTLGSLLGTFGPILVVFWEFQIISL